jgi:hypothetical protein
MNDVEAKIPESKNTNLEEAYIDEYWSTYRQHIHTLLAWGYADSRNRVQAKHDEPAITGFIAEAIQDRLDAFDSPPLRNIQVVDAFPQEWMSIHDRNMGKSIFIHHILLDYCFTTHVGPAHTN